MVKSKLPRLRNQTQLAEALGVSKSTLSKWISKNNVSPDVEYGNKKLYKETIIDAYINDHKLKKDKRSNNLTPLELLKQQVEQQQETIKVLREQLKVKDEQIKTANQLASQAQQLNLTDKDPENLKLLSNSVADNKQGETSTSKRKWWQIFRK